MRGVIIVLYLLLSEGVSALVASKGDVYVPVRSDGAIEVCWANESLNEKRYLADTLEHYAVEEFKEANVKLAFYDSCASLKNSKVPISILLNHKNLSKADKKRLYSLYFGMDMGHPRVFGFGEPTKMREIDMVMTYDFHDVRPRLAKQASELDDIAKLNLLKSIFVHELTHAIGFFHEQDHKDSDCEFAEGYTEKYHELVTKYDPDSIMNYCRTRNHNYGMGSIGFSHLDIEGLKIKFNSAN